MDGQLLNFYESGQYRYFENCFESPQQWNHYDPSFDQNESFENLYDPNEYDHSNQFQDPNPCFQNFQNEDTIFQTEPSLHEILENFIQTTASNTQNLQNHLDACSHISNFEPQFEQDSNDCFENSFNPNLYDHSASSLDQIAYYSSFKDFQNQEEFLIKEKHSRV